MNKPFAVALIAAGSLLLAGCPAGLGGKDYSRSQARTAQEVHIRVAPEKIRFFYPGDLTYQVADDLLLT